MSSTLPPKMTSLATSGRPLYAKMSKQSWLNISITARRKCTKFEQQIGLHNLYQIAKFNVYLFIRSAVKLENHSRHASV